MNRRAFLAGGVGVLALVTGCLGDSPAETPNTPTEPPPSQTATAGRRPSETTTPADEPFHIESKYTEPQTIIAINHHGIVAASDVSYRDSTRTTATDDTSHSPRTVTASTDQILNDNASQVIADSPDTIQLWNASTAARSIAITIEVTDRPADPLGQETYVGDSPENPILNETYTIAPDAYITIQLLKPGDYVVSVGVADRQTTKTITYTTDNCNMQSLLIGVMADGSVESVVTSTMVACMSKTTTTGT
jgi:hypothetical protein